MDKSQYTLLIVRFVATTDYLPILSKAHGMQMVRMSHMSKIDYKYMALEPYHFEEMGKDHLKAICKTLNLI